MIAGFDVLRHPVVAAPMGGGPSTPELVAAVSGAGGLGFLAAGYKRPAQVQEEIARTRALTGRPFGVNVFAPPATPVDARGVAAYAGRLAAEALRWGVGLGDPAGGDDAYQAKVDLLRSDPVPFVSFTFGAPSARTVEDLHNAGTAVWVTVTTPEEAATAVDVGADAVVAQGTEAGAHRGGFTDIPGEGEYGLLVLLRLLLATVAVPVVASGGICDGQALAGVLAAGATAGQLGTAFLRCPEAGTSPVHRQALDLDRPTTLTRAFTGRRARGIVNRFISEHDAVAPAGYPQVHQLTAPLRAAAREAGDAESLHLWAGQGHRLATGLPAAELVRLTVAQAAEALHTLDERLRPSS